MPGLGKGYLPQANIGMGQKQGRQFPHSEKRKANHLAAATRQRPFSVGLSLWNLRQQRADAGGWAFPGLPTTPQDGMVT